MARVRGGWWGLVGLVATVLLVPLRLQAATACAGDCNANGEVAINELITMVNVALDAAPVSACEAGDRNQDGVISIDEIMFGVFKALEGCAAEPTPVACSEGNCRPCTAADVLCFTGQAGGAYCCTLSGSGFTSLGGAAGCESSGIFVNPTPNGTPGANGCWTAPDGPCHSEYICQVANTPTPTNASTATVTATPPATATPSATASGNPTDTPIATPTVMPCNGAQTTACEAQCGLSGCCFNPTPTGVPGNPTPAIGCFDPSVTTPGADNWYGSTTCGGPPDFDYGNACQIVGTPGATGTATATPSGVPTGTASATVTATPSAIVPTGTTSPAQTSTTAASPTATDTPVGMAPTATSTPTTTATGATPSPTATGSPSTRVVTLINKCPFAIWVGAVGAGPDGGAQACSTMACPAGQVCNSRANPNSCVWGLPPADSGSFALGEAGSATDQAVFQVPPSQAVSDGQVFNVNFYGQTGCTSQPTICCQDATLEHCGTQTGCTLGGSDCTQDPGYTTCVDPCVFGPCGVDCASAPCNAPSPSEPCAIGSGPEGAHTQAELNLYMSRVDSYDVSYINGLNVPMEVRPLVDASASKGYFCGNPGGTDSISQLGDCTYAVDTKVTINGGTTDYAPYLRNVLPGGAPCTPTMQDPDPSCPNEGDVCGLTMSTDFATLSTTCGTQVGWWSADEVCAQVPSFNGGPFNCQGMTGQGTFGDLYQCSGNNVQDCYNSTNHNDQCCGCPVWTGVTLPDCGSTPAGNCCYNSNSTWMSYAQPWANVLKTACSTAYSFPNDDVTSTFTCPTTISAGQTNFTAYEVIYCPGGKQGQ